MTTGIWVMLLAVWPAAVLLLVAFNLAVWPRGREDIEDVGNVSVLVPARDEAETIERCVRRIFESGIELEEVVVYDDRSTDQTPVVLDRLAAEFSKLRVVEGEPLPEGWVGKTHACHRLAEEAVGDLLIFVDADTFVERGGLARLLSLLESGPVGRAAMVSAVPKQLFGSFAERLVVPLLHVTYTSWLPLPLVWQTNDPRFVAANGQLMAIRRKVLERHGGYRAIRDALVDDVELAKMLKGAGERVVFADGYRMAHCRMYRSFSEVWEGFSKNLYEGLGSRPVLLAVAVGLYVGTFLAPYLGLVAWGLGAAGMSVGISAAVGVVGNVVLRAGHLIRHDHPIESPVVHPLGVLVLVGIAFNSLRWHTRGAVRWAGRTYAAREKRTPAATDANTGES